MKRRNFLSMLGAAVTVPMIPVPAMAGASATATAAAAGYNRYQYGLAVFQARSQASLGIADLVARLHISTAQAEAMLGEMRASGIVAPVMNSASNAVRALTQHNRDSRPVIRDAARKLAKLVDSDETPTADNTAPVVDTRLDPAHDIEIKNAPIQGQETDNGKV